MCGECGVKLILIFNFCPEKIFTIVFVLSQGCAAWYYVLDCYITSQWLSENIVIFAHGITHYSVMLNNSFRHRQHVQRKYSPFMFATVVVMVYFCVEAELSQ